MEKNIKLDNSPQMLSEAEELLLMSFADGEAGLWARLRARQLLKVNGSAREYFLQLQQVKKELRTEPNPEVFLNHPKVDLWDKIQLRLEQEQHNELLLGKRKFEHSVSSRSAVGSLAFLSTGNFLNLGQLASRFQQLGNLGWGLSGGLAGGVVAASLTVLLIGRTPSNISQGADSQVAKANKLEVSSSNLQLVSVGSSHQAVDDDDLIPAGATPHPIERIEPTTVEVDWMRSDGRVRMMQEPNDRAAIIWVTRREEPRVPVVRVRRSVPPAVFSVRSGSMPRIQNRVPRAVPAYSAGE